MQIELLTDETAAPSVSANGGAWQIISFTSLTFVVYLAIGLPLAILPEYVHMRMGYHASLAGLVISIQYIATFLSRPWAGRISDRKGAKISVLWGMGACTLSGLLLLAAAALHRNPAWLSLTILIASRLVLGVGESLGSTGATLWGISSAGPEHTAKVISYNGVSTYGALALGAPLGVVMETHWGLTSVAILTIIICAIAYVWAALKPPVPVTPGEHLPFRSVLGRVMPHGTGLALGGVGYSALATFVTLFYASRRWDGAALCLTAFGFAFIATRLLFIRTIGTFGGFPVTKVCLIVESLGVLLLWLSVSPWMALCGAAWPVLDTRSSFRLSALKPSSACRWRIAAPPSASTPSSPTSRSSWSAPSPAPSSEPSATPASFSSLGSAYRSSRHRPRPRQKEMHPFLRVSRVNVRSRS